MANRRFTIYITDPDRGGVRRLSVSRRAVALGIASLLAVPALLMVGARWSARAELAQLRATNTALVLENGNYRETTGQLASQIQSLESVIDDLGVRSHLAPEQAAVMAKLPAMVKAKAAGGATRANLALATVLSTSLISPEDTFGALRSLLQGLEGRLTTVKRGVEQQQALANATPSIWPAHGWLTGHFGERSDPFTGAQGFHEGLDISASKGEPVFATADGHVEQAAYAAEYGNLIVVNHDFGLSTRYGHLSAFNVRAGQVVHRGDVIGFVGATGRATGSHLHYEIRANGQLLNPLTLLTQPTSVAR